MEKNIHLATGTLVLLIISLANICFLALAVVYYRSRPKSSSEQASRKTDTLGSFALGLAFASQILYLVVGSAWLVRWVQFYPGNPIQNLVIIIGLVLSAASFVTAFLGTGIKRYASVLSSVIVGGLWLLSAVASVAV
jgi:hypothetical protein